MDKSGIRAAIIGIGLFTLPSYFFAVEASEQVDSVVDMVLADMKQSGELSDMSKCFKVSEKSTLNAVEKSLKSCFNQHPEQLSGTSNPDILSSCVKQNLMKKLSLSENQYQSCEAQYAEDEQGEDIYDTMSTHELAEQIDQDQAESMAMLEQSLSQQKAMAAGTEHTITLPIYSNSQLLSNYPQGITIGDIQALPVAMFKSPDSLKKISDFYKKALSHYAVKNYDFGYVLFMPSFPEGFHPHKGLQVLATTPHISITPSSDGTGSNIEIAYPKK
ncbi:hypothetical protein [Aliikangiella sp. IMCC44632]